MLNHSLDTVLNNLIDISRKAGEEILDVYSDSFNITLKDDLSPLTDADRRANGVITSMLLSMYPDIPILSEEGREIEFFERKDWNLFWVVDPLDGTKEFIKRNGEFTVNIALVENCIPIAGVVYSPVKKTFWYGADGFGSHRMVGTEKAERISVTPSSKSTIRIVTSRSHPSEKLEKYISRFNNFELIKMGSSLKICLVADGSAHIYPRLGPTMEWDSAAGHAVLKFSGGELIDASTGTELMYNKENLRNPDFICLSDSIRETYEVL